MNVEWKEKGKQLKIETSEEGYEGMKIEDGMSIE